MPRNRENAKHSSPWPWNRRKWAALHFGSSWAFFGFNREHNEVFKSRRPVRIPGRTKCCSRDRPCGDERPEWVRRRSTLAYSIVVSCELWRQRSPTKGGHLGGVRSKKENQVEFSEKLRPRITESVFFDPFYRNHFSRVLKNRRCSGP